MNRTINRTLGSILLASVAVSNAETKCEPGVQAAHELTLKDDRNGETKLGFLLRTPPATAAKPTNGWPLLIFLHGSGERGTDTAKVKSHGPPSLVGKKPALDQMIVLSPQCPPDRWWDIVALKNLIDSIVLDQHADPKRIYLTGLSMGGYATWDLLAAHPKFFAALFPFAVETIRRRHQHSPACLSGISTEPKIQLCPLLNLRK